MAPKYKAPRGTQDVLPQVSWRWQRLEAAFRDTCRRFGYSEIRTPTFEETELFTRGVGEGTELVGKQMYTFEDRGGRSITLRAEGTAPVVRAYLEHNLSQAGGVQKLYYITPIFRYERPQAGRLRQHHQLGIEAIGAPGPDIDAEVIALYHDFLGAVNIQGGVTHLSSIGCPQCRPAFQEALRAFFQPVIAEMCDFCQARYQTNPLRILDCKVPHDVELRVGAPSALDLLCSDCREHFAGVRTTLDALGIPYQVDPTIVRGLDYYSRTAFEVIHSGLGAKDVLMGGGRYDGLAEMLGGPATPGIGFGSGIERLLMVTEASGGESQAAPKPDVYVVAATDNARSEVFDVAVKLRRSGLTTVADFRNRSLKAQMKEAGQLGSRFAVIIGEDEMRQARATIRDMASGSQFSVPALDVDLRLQIEIFRALRREARNGARMGSAERQDELPAKQEALVRRALGSGNAKTGHLVLLLALFDLRLLVGASDAARRNADEILSFYNSAPGREDVLLRGLMDDYLRDLASLYDETDHADVADDLRRQAEVLRQKDQG